MADRHHPTSPGRPGYEMQDLKVGAIGKFLIGLFLLICVTLLGMNELFRYFERRAVRQDIPLPPLVETRELPPEPRLQVTPATDLQKLRATEAEILTTYGWVHRDQGIVRIPIERAIDLLLEREAAHPFTGQMRSPGGTLSPGDQ